ncbi:MAG: prolipoprotein diacylglyceryl transferase [Leptospirales bacterium]|nr:prolipoprotein diacylglyceryl transferase [Leptospirales bacterium]
MDPVLFRFTIGESEKFIPSYGFMMLLSIATAFIIVRLLSKKPPFNGKFEINSLLWVIACTIAGAHIAGFLLFMPEFISGAMNFKEPVLISWGGITGGVIGAAAASRLWKITPASLADILSPAFLASMGIGRIGCFLGGCCFGIQTDLPIGLAFPPSCPAGMTAQPLLPVQLISAAYLTGGASAAAFIYVKKKNIAHGRLFAFSAMFYSLGRFIVEFFRNDHRVFFIGLSDGQLFSICFFATACIILYKTRQKIIDEN